MNRRTADVRRNLALGAAHARIGELERRVVVLEAREREVRDLREQVQALRGSLHASWQRIECLERSGRAAGFVESGTESPPPMLAPEPRRAPAVAVARRLGVAPATVRRLVEAGRLEGLALPIPDRARRVWVVDLASVERFEREAAGAGAVGAVGALRSAFPRPEHR